MRHIHFFQYNIPADNHTTGRADDYISVLGKWYTDQFYSDGRPMTFAYAVDLTFGDCIKVKDWTKAYFEIEAIVQNHFEVLAREERINQARAVLAIEENPILNRFEAAQFDL